MKVDLRWGDETMKRGEALGDHGVDQRLRRRSWSNKTAGIFISLGGIGVIAVVVAIFVFIGYETIPLWSGPKMEHRGSISLEDKEILAIGENEYRTVGYAISRRGTLTIFNPGDSSSFQSMDLAVGGVVSAVIDPTQRYAFIIGLDDSAYFLEMPGSYPREPQRFSRLIPLLTVSIPSDDLPLAADFVSPGERDFVAVVAGGRRGPRVLFVRKGSIFSGSTPEIILKELPGEYSARISVIAVDQYAERVVAGTGDGTILYWDIRDPEFPQMIQSLKVSPLGVTAMKFLLGGQVLIVGDAGGRVTSWTWALDSTSVNGIGVVPLNQFDRHPGTVTAIASAHRNKSFVTADATGGVSLHYQTGGRTILSVSGAGGIRALSVSPRDDGLLLLDDRGIVSIDSLYNPHPEASLKTLFGKVQYEGYDHPTHTWQSTGGTDDFEPKLSLVPLIFGTLKGAVYAMLFALPVAVFGALYTALFAHPTIKAIVKPIVEIMAALPSVVIGFVAALWLAPLLETRFVDVALIVAVFPLSVFVVLSLWRLLPAGFTNRFLYGSEILLLVPALAGFMYLATLLAAPAETAFFNGSFRQWLFETAHVTYDQRNSIVVGFAMGFAVIPIIFTISEDALSSVPGHLTAGSLALGATRWQTATRVVLPTASPGIFSAAMIGFGRAVGETMIVLMATGNTPVLDFSPFTGMRTLSANIAVEIPEAPYLGTLYRVLFFSGLLLFAFTFLVNTIAEVIRQRLRKRYSTI